MRTILILAAVAGCGSPQRTAGEPTQSGTQTAEPVSEIEAECRTQEVAAIGEADRAYGPTCDRQTMPLTLKIFSRGASAGEASARDLAQTDAMMCICLHEHCSDEEQAKVAEQVKQSLGNVDAVRRRITSRVLSDGAGHSCLDAAIGAQVAKFGFECAFTEAQKPEHANAALASALARSGVDQRTAATWAAECANPK